MLSLYEVYSLFQQNVLFYHIWRQIVVKSPLNLEKWFQQNVCKNGNVCWHSQYYSLLLQSCRSGLTFNRSGSRFDPWKKKVGANTWGKLVPCPILLQNWILIQDPNLKESRIKISDKKKESGSEQNKPGSTTLFAKQLFRYELFGKLEYTILCHFKTKGFLAKDFMVLLSELKTCCARIYIDK